MVLQNALPYEMRVLLWQHMPDATGSEGAVPLTAVGGPPDTLGGRFPPVSAARGVACFAVSSENAAAVSHARLACACCPACLAHYAHFQPPLPQAHSQQSPSRRRTSYTGNAPGATPRAPHEAFLDFISPRGMGPAANRRGALGRYFAHSIQPGNSVVRAIGLGPVVV